MTGLIGEKCAQAIAAVARITRGDFRLIDRLFIQIERVMRINELSTITDDRRMTAKSAVPVSANVRLRRRVPARYSTRIGSISSLTVRVLNMAV
ncbi:hypothetical protein ACX80S_13335 [Arthrobacter sp. RHLT1-20]